MPLLANGTWSEFSYEYESLTEPDLPSPANPSLPPALEQRSDGAIVVRGHRITLFAILESIEGGKTSILQLHNRFPTLSRDDVWEALHFINNNPDWIREYAKQQKAIASDAKQRFPYTGPPIDVLRQRLGRSLP